MKILFSSHCFAPSVGGIEEVSGILAEEFGKMGHDVTVVTRTPGNGLFPFSVKRRPGPAALARLARWSDVVFHNNLSLRTAWPLLAIRRPWVVAHHTCLARADGRVAAVDRLKQRVVRGASNVAVSTAIAARLDARARVIPNPYRDELFRRTDSPRTADIIFVGRLVSDKGVDVLLDALGTLKRRGSPRRLTIVGDGPERAPLEAQAERLGVDARFAGVRRGEELAALLNEHRVLVAPSRWEEPFGLVALEGMACGCVPVVARSGGLPEAVGDAGVVFDKGDARALADCIEKLDEGRIEALRRAAAPHLEKHRAESIARQYLEVLEEAAAG